MSKYTPMIDDRHMKTHYELMKKAYKEMKNKEMKKNE